LLFSTNFKILKQIIGNSVNDCNVFIVHNFCQTRPLFLPAAGSKKLNYVTDPHISFLSLGRKQIFSKCWVLSIILQDVKCQESNLGILQCEELKEQTIQDQLPSLKVCNSISLRYEIFAHHHHRISFMELGHLLTRSGLTHPEVSSKVYNDFCCQMGSSVSLPWVISCSKHQRHNHYNPLVPTNTHIILIYISPHLFRPVAIFRQLTTKQLKGHSNKLVLNDALHMNVQIMLKFTLYKY